MVDDAEAAQSPFGRWVASAPAGPLGWAVRTRRLDDVARRLGLTVAAGARGELRWRLAGIEQAAAEPYLPFFIEWAPGTPFPGRDGVGELEQLHLTGDPDRLAAWLGEDHSLPITVSPNLKGPGPLSFTLRSGEG